MASIFASGAPSRRGPDQDLPSLFDSLQRQMRVPSALSELARETSPIFLRSQDEALGIDPKDTALENAERALEALRGDGRLFVVFEGATPKSEGRDWVVGNVEGRFRGVAFTLATLPLDVLDDVYWATPGTAVGPLSRYAVTTVPGALFAAFAPEPTPEPEADAPEADAPEDEA